MLVSGLHESEDNPGGAKISVKTTEDYLSAVGPQENLVEGEWVTISFDLGENPDWASDEDLHDPSDVRKLEIEMRTGSEGTFTPSVILIDSIIAEQAIR